MATLVGKNQISCPSKRDYLTTLEAKAAFLDEILSFIEDKALGHLMEATESERNIPLSKARQFIKPSK